MGRHDIPAVDEEGLAFLINAQQQGSIRAEAQCLDLHQAQPSTRGAPAHGSVPSKCMLQGGAACHHLCSHLLQVLKGQGAAGRVH